MTNAEKYKEVFGMVVDPTSCPTKSCLNCPCRETDPNGRTISCSPGTMYDWWHKEYKGKYEERPQGEWIYTPNISGLSEYEGITCSICGNDSVGDFNFCPNCGADMRG